MTDTIKPLDRTLPIEPSDWIEFPHLSGYVASLVIYGNVYGEEKREGHVALLQGLELILPEPRELQVFDVPITLDRFLFNARYETRPNTEKMRFRQDHRGRLAIWLTGQKEEEDRPLFDCLNGTLLRRPLLVPGMLWQADFFAHQRPMKAVQIRPMFHPISNAEALQWYMENAVGGRP